MKNSPQITQINTKKYNLCKSCGIKKGNIHPRYLNSRKCIQPNGEPIEELNKISYEIIGCAFKVHSQLGPGLLESTYEVCLEYELIKLGLKVQRQVSLPVYYDEVKLDAGYRIDILVDDKVILELKSIDAVAPVHEAQLLTYLKLSGKKLGLLINFNVKNLKEGIMRRVM